MKLVTPYKMSNGRMDERLHPMSREKNTSMWLLFFYVVFLLLLFRLMDLQQRIRQLNKTDPVHQMERPRRISVMSQTPPTRLTNYVIFVISTARFNIYLMTVVVRVWLGIYDIEIYQRNSMCYLVVACVFLLFCLSFFCRQSFVAA